MPTPLHCQIIYRFISISCFVLLATPALAQNDLSNFTINGDAERLTGSQSNCYQLTPDVEWQGGAIWSPNQIDLTLPFVVEATLFLGCQNGPNDCNVGADTDGADGMVFAIQPLATNIGGQGAGMGFETVSPSLGIEFDTFRNDDFADPIYDHMTIVQNGVLNHNTAFTLAGPTPISASSDNVEDCTEHNLKIAWDPNTQTIEVYFDCELRLTYTSDIINTIFSGQNFMYWGFTAGTGGCYNIHRVCMNIPPTFNFSNTALLCQGDSVRLHELALPSGFEFSWAPSEGLVDPNEFSPIAIPQQTTTYVLTLTNACNEQTEYEFTVNIADFCDCFGMPNGIGVIDDCGVCLIPSDPAFNQTCLDCNGTLFGNAVLDNCGVCLVPNDPIFNRSCNNVMIPNAFSPNNDGINDSFNIMATDIATYNLSIYNRWGQLVYQSSNSNNSWDGLFRGENQAIGVYVYILAVEFTNGQSELYQGNVSLIR